MAVLNVRVELKRSNPAPTLQMGKLVAQMTIVRAVSYVTGASWNADSPATSPREVMFLVLIYVEVVSVSATSVKRGRGIVMMTVTARDLWYARAMRAQGPKVVIIIILH